MYIENLKKFREKENITQEQIAEELEIKRQQYYRYETGKIDLPIKYLVKLSKFYQKSTDEILGINREIL